MKWSTLLTIAAVGTAVVAVAGRRKRRRKPKIIITPLIQYNAKCLPPFGIFVDPRHAHNKNLIDHELRHWDQYQDKGLLRYHLDYICELAMYGYDKMPMEIEARANEPDDVKTDYTNAVRDGRSLTVYNPDFRK